MLNIFEGLEIILTPKMDFSQNSFRAFDRDDSWGLATPKPPNWPIQTPPHTHSLWTMHFDGARARYGSRIGVILTFPLAHPFPFSIMLGFNCTNNVAKYESLIFSLNLAKKLKINVLKILR
jgi:hypothetical protein